jgi:hypothetical protein
MHRADGAEVEWLSCALNREGAPFCTPVRLVDDEMLQLVCGMASRKSRHNGAPFARY